MQAQIAPGFPGRGFCTASVSPFPSLESIEEKIEENNVPMFQEFDAELCLQTERAGNLDLLKWNT
jgi:hypothetical protein